MPLKVTSPISEDMAKVSTVVKEFGSIKSENAWSRVCIYIKEMRESQNKIMTKRLRDELYHTLCQVEGGATDCAAANLRMIISTLDIDLE